MDPLSLLPGVIGGLLGGRGGGGSTTLQSNNANTVSTGLSANVSPNITVLTGLGNSSSPQSGDAGAVSAPASQTANPYVAGGSQPLPSYLPLSQSYSSRLTPGTGQLSTQGQRAVMPANPLANPTFLLLLIGVVAIAFVATE